MSAHAQLRGVKQAIVARDDLGMGVGKLAAQVAHASLLACNGADAGAVKDWKHAGQKKVVLRVDDEESVHALNELAKAAGLPTGLVRDAGRTQLEAGTVTALAIGPASTDRIDEITGDLPLY